MIIIRNIILETDDINLLKEKVAKLINRKKFDFEIYRKSIDARKEIKFNFQVLVNIDLSDKEIKRIKGAARYEVEDLKIEVHKPEKEVSIIGSGPAGLFCAYILSKYKVKVHIYERGEKIEDRIKTIEDFIQGKKDLNLESNVQFGEGGAGTYSDGKLTARTKDKRQREVLKIFVDHGAPKDIMYEKKPHVGTDLLRKVIISMRKEIEKNGGVFHFSHKLEDIEIKNGKVRYMVINGEKISTPACVLALGNSSRDTFEILSKKIPMENKNFAVGFRIEHKREDINLAQYSGHLYQKSGKVLPAATYNLSYNDKDLGLGAYTFCMCPGGHVIDASSEANRKCVNGMSYHGRNAENSNTALIVTVDEKIYGNKLLDSMQFQRKIEEKAYEVGQGKIPVQRLEDFINNVATKKLGRIKPSVKPSYKLSNLRGIYPEVINQMIIKATAYMGKRLKGFDDKDAILSGVEVRSSSPVRLLRDKENKSLGLNNLYVIGEGSGYSGGIVSSAIDGIKTAENLLNKK
ncbi:MAG: NAD(P)/FAD-dependent oxidoreductase [Peptoniphilaceae bacterium]|nr:NAD(P)/FAD-dependent oxidoreductase [Peptoniphilaceae bacterium]MDY6018462.1 NAD(P)/FAD-dependent oxidoreductase [Anaerococcus sp.]